VDQKWSERTDAETLFKDEESVEMSDSVWPADTNRRIPMGSLHLSRFDFFDVTMKTESSFKTLSAIVSRRSRSVVGEPVDFFSLRKTIGDRTWLEN
jgi:hypothetical protein